MTPEPLKRLLENLDDAWRQAHFAVADEALPGLKPADVREQLTALKLAPHPDLIDWFSWHNGARNEQGRVTPSAWLQSLDEATDSWSLHVTEWGEYAPLRAWFPILDIAPGAICLNSDTGKLALIEFRQMVPDRWHLPSLSFMVREWLTRISDGRWSWDGEHQRIRSEDSREDPDLLRTGAF